MKKAMIVMLSLLLVLSLAACNTANVPPEEPVAPVEPEEPAAPEEPDAPEEPVEPDEPETPGLGVVAGAAMYRGTVKTVEEAEGGLLVRLEQEKGVNYGYKTLEVLLDEDTNTDFDLADLAEGMHLEIYYGAPMGIEVEQPVRAIQAGRLADGDLTVFNGIVTAITTPEEDDGEMGVLMMEDLDSGETVQFNYSLATQFYLDTDGLAEGDALNIFFSGATTRSIPPQAFAMEVRPYAAPDSIE